MFDFLRRKKKTAANKPGDVDSLTEKEFSFIWYKEMKIGNKTIFTAPFRTVVKAKTAKEGVRKILEFATKRMTVKVIEESALDKDKFQKMQKHFDEISEFMEGWIKKIDDDF